MTNFKEEKKQLFTNLGVKMQDHFSSLNFLVRTAEDWKEFMSDFTGNVAQSIQAFKMKKQRENEVSLEEFMEKVKTNKKLALEVLFQEPVGQAKIDLLPTNNMVEIYETHMKNPSYDVYSLSRMWNIVKNSTMESTKELDLILS